MRTRIALRSIVAVAASMTVSAQAAVKTWTSSDTAVTGTNNALWSFGDNWNADTAPLPLDSLAFNAPVTGGTRTTSNDFTAGTQFNGISVNANAYALAGNAINLGGNYALTLAAASTTNSMSVDATLLQNTDISVASVGAGTQPRIDWNSVISGNFGITKLGGGVLRFQTNAKTYAGDTTVSAGTLDIVLNNSLPSGLGKGNVLINTGAVMQLNNSNLAINGLSDGASGGGSITKIGSGGRTLTFGNADANGSFSGNFVQSAGTLNLAKTGTGSQSLGGNSNYTGTTAVNGGTLLVNGTHSNAGNYTVAATAGTTLGGTGAINLAAATNVVTVNGKLAPGSAATAIESLDIGVGDLTLAGTADFQIDLTASTFDEVNVGDLLTYGGALNVAFSGTDLDGAMFDIFDFASATGTFSQVNFTGLAAEQTASFDPTTGVVTLNAVPEPAALSLLGLGGLTLLARRRRTA
jgi:autotransporter-associated beta strand protein